MYPSIRGSIESWFNRRWTKEDIRDRNIRLIVSCGIENLEFYKNLGAYKIKTKKGEDLWKKKQFGASHYGYVFDILLRGHKNGDKELLLFEYMDGTSEKIEKIYDSCDGMGDDLFNYVKEQARRHWVNYPGM